MATENPYLAYKRILPGLVLVGGRTVLCTAVFIWQLPCALPVGASQGALPDVMPAPVGDKWLAASNSSLTGPAAAIFLSAEQ